MAKKNRRNQHVLIEDDCTEAEWDELAQRLEKLSFEEVKQIAEEAGLGFVSDIKFATDFDIAKERHPTKDDYIGFMDEAYWDEFEAAYERLINNRSSG